MKEIFVFLSKKTYQTELNWPKTVDAWLACISFLQCPCSWKSLLGVSMLNSRQKNHWKIQHCLVWCFALSKQLRVQLVLSFQDCYWSVFLG